MMPLLVVIDYPPQPLGGSKHVLNTWDERTLCDLIVPLDAVSAAPPTGYPCTQCGDAMDRLTVLAEAAVG